MHLKAVEKIEATLLARPQQHETTIAKLEEIRAIKKRLLKEAKKLREMKPAITARWAPPLER